MYLTESRDYIENLLLVEFWEFIAKTKLLRLTKFFLSQFLLYKDIRHVYTKIKFKNYTKYRA